MICSNVVDLETQITTVWFRFVRLQLGSRAHHPQVLHHGVYLRTNRGFETFLRSFSGTDVFSQRFPRVEGSKCSHGKKCSGVFCFTAGRCS